MLHNGLARHSLRRSWPSRGTRSIQSQIWGIYAMILLYCSHLSLSVGHLSDIDSGIGSITSSNNGGKAPAWVRNPSVSLNASIQATFPLGKDANVYQWSGFTHA